MGKLKFSDKSDQTLAKFEKISKFAKNQDPKRLTLKEQIEKAEKEKIKKETTNNKKLAEEERFIQTSFYFKHERQ